MNEALEIVVSFEEKSVLKEKVSDHCGKEKLNCSNTEDFSRKVDAKASFDSVLSLVVLRGIELI